MPPKKGNKKQRAPPQNQFRRGAKMRAQIDGVVTLVPQYVEPTKGSESKPRPPRGYMANESGGFDRKEGFKPQPVQYSPYNRQRKKMLEYLRSKKRATGLTPEEELLYSDLLLKMQKPVENATGDVTKTAVMAAEKVADDVGTDAAEALVGEAILS